MSKITLSPDCQKKFEMAIKIGVVKELHRGKMLTDTQLSQLLSNIRSQDTHVPDGSIEQAG